MRHGTFGDVASIVSGCLMSSTVYATSLSWLPRSLIVPLPKSHTDTTGARE